MQLMKPLGRAAFAALLFAPFATQAQSLMPDSQAVQQMRLDVYTLAEEVTKGLEGMEVPLRVAVMGCVVNGPGEAREADLGVASGNGKGQIFVRGEVIKTVPEDEIVATLIAEANRLAAESSEVGSPQVSVG